VSRLGQVSQAAGDVPTVASPGPSAPVVASDVSFDPGRLAGVTAIWVRELRGRMRGKRAFVFLTFYLSLLAIILWLALRTTEDLPGLTVTEAMSIGRGIFIGVLLVETLVVVALAPAYTAGAISAEREKQTYDLLAVTPISSLALVVGKLLSGLSYLALVVFASFPIACLAFLFGGIEPGDIIRGYLVLVVTGVGIGAIGVWCSAAMARTQTATVAAFIVTAAMVVGASAAWLALDSRFEGRTTERPPQALLWLNPFLAQLDVICEAGGDGCFAQQAAMPRADLAPVIVVDPTTGEQIDLGLGGQVVTQPTPAGGGFWPKVILVYIGIAILGIFGASQSISPTRRWRPALRSRRGAASETTSHD
jgi:ABC-type transport system involved in multi-copper enzyme maturation permease subunit